MNKHSQFLMMAFLLVTSSLVSVASLAGDDKKSINQTLDNFHQAAANAEAKPYFDLLSEDAIFLGTDASERWTKAEFKAFVVPYFSKGRGWLYTPTERNITLIDSTQVDSTQIKSKQVAFFDELLFSKSYGVCRGSGVLINTSAGWKISQYNLSIPMPNGIAKALVKQIKDFEPSK